MVSLLYIGSVGVPPILNVLWLPKDTRKIRKFNSTKQSAMANDTDTGEHPMVSQEGVMVPSVAFMIERFDVSRLDVGASNAAVDTPQVAAADRRVVDASQDASQIMTGLILKQGDNGMALISSVAW